MPENNLSLRRWLEGPVIEFFKAQHRASEAYLDFLSTVCFPQGKAQMIEIVTEEPMLDEQGRHADSRRYLMRVPIAGLISHPHLQVESARVQMDLEVTETEQEYTRFGKIPFSDFKACPVAGKSRRRRRDARRAVRLETKLTAQSQPEGLQRLMEILTDYHGSVKTQLPKETH